MTAASETFDNVNFQILLKQHGGNVQRALQAWQAICRLGNFGDIPHTYEGGLDVKGLRIYRDEFDHGGIDEEAVTGHFSARDMKADPRNLMPIANARPLPASGDDIKRLEDIAAGDAPLTN